MDQRFGGCRKKNGCHMAVRHSWPGHSWPGFHLQATCGDSDNDLDDSSKPIEVLRSWTLFSFFRYFPPFILRSQSLVPHSFPYAPLGPPPNHLTSHLMDHLTIPQSDITCHHSAVRSTPQHHHLTLYGLPAHCHVMMRPPGHDGAILRTANS